MEWWFQNFHAYLNIRAGLCIILICLELNNMSDYSLLSVIKTWEKQHMTTKLSDDDTSKNFGINLQRLRHVWSYDAWTESVGNIKTGSSYHFRFFNIYAKVSWSNHPLRTLEMPTGAQHPETYPSTLSNLSKTRKQTTAHLSWTEHVSKLHLQLREWIIFKITHLDSYLFEKISFLNQYSGIFTTN
jgi:hypothetical protein